MFEQHRSMLSSWPSTILWGDQLLCSSKFTTLEPYYLGRGIICLGWNCSILRYESDLVFIIVCRAPTKNPIQYHVRSRDIFEQRKGYGGIWPWNPLVLSVTTPRNYQLNKPMDWPSANEALIYRWYPVRREHYPLGCIIYPVSVMIKCFIF